MVEECIEAISWEWVEILFLGLFALVVVLAGVYMLILALEYVFDED